MLFNKESITERLKSFGYEVTEDDDWMLTFCMEKVTKTIMNYCNVSTIPEDLNPTAIDMVCGEFLRIKRQTGQLQIGGLDFSGIVTSIKQGDTSVSFSSGMSDEEKVDTLIEYLADGKDDLLCYRRMYW